MQEAHKKFILSLTAAAVGGGLTLYLDGVIRSHFPTRLILQDYLFDITPHVPSLSYLADGIIAFSFALVLLILSAGKLQRISQFAFAFGCMLFFRSILNFLTPIGDPGGDTEIYGFLERKPLVGMFPSGHIAALNLEYWLVKSWGVGKKWEWLLLGFIVLEAIALILTRGHYSIDIAGGIALGYFAAKFAKKFI